MSMKSDVGLDKIFHKNQISFSSTDLVVVELPYGPDGLVTLLSALLEAEINIYYTYSLLIRPHSRAVLAFHAEDGELAIDVLKRHGFTTLGQADLSR